MAAKKKINLLPKELGKALIDTKEVKLARNIAYAVVGLLIVANAAGMGLYFFFDNDLKQIKTSEQRLKSNITSLEETEHRLILTKDRIGKIQNIINSRTQEEKLNKHIVLTNNLPLSVQLEAQNIDNSKASLEFSANNSKDLVNFMAVILARPEFSSIVMESLGFNPFQGYKITLDIF